ncbi:hypothetical protein [Hyphomicrobium sp. CS1GBMeth3]|uniref:hypothetical protein n=1 Tax=Hyphomicrobium sp. CS1GBMeth3 TaxID=1892845 RepID=UPI000931CAD9|nr:hypothetical protein [Hyphomicrobium sp. CS1GBMeth3]
MARILICHVPKDGSLARELGAALMGRGHFVSFDGEPDSTRPDRSARLRQFEAVIVLWTETSAHSAGLAGIAREVLPLNLLVPVRAADLPVTRLPLSFRKLSMPAPRDIDGIARVVARLSTAASSLREFAERQVARRPGATAPAPAGSTGGPLPPRQQPPPPAIKQTAAQRSAPSAASSSGPVVTEPAAGPRVRPLLDLPEVETVLSSPVAPSAPPQPPAPAPANATPAVSAPPRPTPRVFGAEDLGRAIDAGLLAYHIPAAMWLGAPTTIEITLGRDVLVQLFPAKDSHGGSGQTLETLSVSLYGSADAFEIERQSERTQFVSAKHALATHHPATFGRWAWLMTPCAAGPHDVVIRVSALMRDARGVPVPLALPDRRLSIDVQVPEEESFSPAFAGWHRS